MPGVAVGPQPRDHGPCNAAERDDIFSRNFRFEPSVQQTCRTNERRRASFRGACRRAARLCWQSGWLYFAGLRSRSEPPAGRFPRTPLHCSAGRRSLAKAPTHRATRPAPRQRRDFPQHAQPQPRRADASRVRAAQNGEADSAPLREKITTDSTYELTGIEEHASLATNSKSLIFRE
jgi:hypothetical protein